MKFIKIIFLPFFFPVLLLAQKHPISADTGFGKIQENTYRITVTGSMFPDYETDALLGGQYERKLANTFSIVAKIGVGTSVKDFGPIENTTQISIHFFGAFETRYYFSLKRRVRRKKSVLNFSGPYISLEQNIITNPIALINQTVKDAIKGSTALYINVGYQKQYGKFYLGAFLGIPLTGERFSTTSSKNVSAHGGTIIGYVF